MILPFIHSVKLFPFNSMALKVLNKNWLGRERKKMMNRRKRRSNWRVKNWGVTGGWGLNSNSLGGAFPVPPPNPPPHLVGEFSYALYWDLMSPQRAFSVLRSGNGHDVVSLMASSGRFTNYVPETSSLWTERIEKDNGEFHQFEWSELRVGTMAIE